MADRSQWSALLAGSDTGAERLRALLDSALDALARRSGERGGPLPAGGPQAAREAVAKVLGDDPFRSDGLGESRLRSLLETYAQWAADLTHPSAVSRMQCAPTAAAAAADFLASALNQSLHSWESGPFAVELERRVLRELADWVGFGPAADGTLTPGGSISNLMGLMLSRDRGLLESTGEDVTDRGLPQFPNRPVILASANAHFSIARSAAFLGLGRDAVRPVPVDGLGRMVPAEAVRALEGLADGEVPLALVATAGTTDRGAFDPLRELSAIAREHGLWLHVDAAYGVGALFSPHLRHLLDGVELADSIALDLHKFGWTPASASALLVRDRALMGSMAQQAVYLNPPDDEEEGYSALLSTSLQTTRRVDALKIAASMLVLGKEGMGAWADACHAQARYAAERIRELPGLELAGDPILSTVVFRCVPEPGLAVPDEGAWNAAVRRHLMERGTALVARTKAPRPDGTVQVHLKLVFLNPATERAEIDAILTSVTTAAREVAGRAGTGAA